jgi:hypothetical protein
MAALYTGGQTKRPHQDTHDAAAGLHGDIIGGAMIRVVILLPVAAGYNVLVLLAVVIRCCRSPRALAAPGLRSPLEKNAHRATR